MKNIEMFLTTLQKGKSWMEALLDLGAKDRNFGVSKKNAIETNRRREFEHTAKLYLESAPEISQLIQPGCNDSKMKLNAKFSDIVLLGKEIARNHKIAFDNSINNFRQKMDDIIKQTKILKEEIIALRSKESNSNRNIKFETLTSKKSNFVQMCGENNSRDSYNFVSFNNVRLPKSRSESLNKLQNVKHKVVKSAECYNNKLTTHNTSTRNNTESKHNCNVDRMKEMNKREHLVNLEGSCQDTYNTAKLNIPDDFLSVENLGKKLFYDRSKTSVALINQLSNVLKEGSLNNLLVQSELSFPSKSKEHLVVPELFEVLTGKKVPVERNKEVELCNMDLQDGGNDFVFEFEALKTKENNASNKLRSNKMAAEKNEDSTAKKNNYKKELGLKQNEINQLGQAEDTLHSNESDVLTSILEKYFNDETPNVLKRDADKEMILKSINLLKKSKAREKVPNRMTDISEHNTKQNYSKETNNLTIHKSKQKCESSSFMNKEYRREHSNQLGSNSRKRSNHLGLGSATIQQITDMLFSLSSVLNQVPEDLKYSRLEDLNPPQSMKSAISLLAHISKTVDVVNIVKSFHFSGPPGSGTSNHSA